MKPKEKALEILRDLVKHHGYLQLENKAGYVLVIAVPSQSAKVSHEIYGFKSWHHALNGLANEYRRYTGVVTVTVSTVEMKYCVKQYYASPDKNDEPVINAYLNELESRGWKVERGARGAVKFINMNAKPTNGKKLYLDLFNGFIWE